MARDKLKVRIVDYVANPGGGVRFVIEMLRELVCHPDVSYELISHGAALQRYRALIEANKISIDLRDIPPENNPRLDPVGVYRGLFIAIALRLIGRRIPWEIRVHPRVLQDCDVVWYPWIHRHETSWDSSTPIVATFHDAIGMEFKGIWPDYGRQSEFELASRWFASDATILATSNATTQTLESLFGVRRSRFQVIRLTGMHADTNENSVELPQSWQWLSSPYILCPANVCLHKNHETLLYATAAWDSKIPVVLVGSGTDWNDVSGGKNPRQQLLKHLDASLELSTRQKIIGLGYVDDATYYTLLRNAWAVVMPTLAEGGGSFPVAEAIVRGIPTICSDIPVMQEFIAANNGKVWWFEARDQNQLGERLNEFELNYNRIKSESCEATKSLCFEAWGDVAKRYTDVFSALQKRT